MNWSALPFVRLILPFGTGIWLGTAAISLPLLPCSVSFGLLLIALFFFVRRRLRFRYRRWYGLLLLVTVLHLGYFLSHLHSPENHPLHLQHYLSEAVCWQLRVDKSKERANSIRLGTTVLSWIDSTGSPRPASGRLLVYLPKDSAAHALLPGDHLLVRGGIIAIPPPQNPKAFDFAAYMGNRGLYHQIFPKSRDWKKVAAETSNLAGWFGQLQQYCLSILKAYLPDPGSLSIGAGLILGRRELVNEEIRNAYTASGAIHVLAVSGLHVGMIYLGLGWLLQLIGCRGRQWRWPKAITLILVVWSYAFFTGGSASVLRAATMFSCIILGNALFRKQNIYNTLAASAFLLLGFQPHLLFDVGFQLSYLAVTGIVFFQGRIYRAWYLPHAAGRHLWKLASVSLAAQLTTLPISLFYFHQFPVYFWLSGWVVVPAAMIVLGLGILLLIFGKVGALASLIGTGLYAVIYTMNTLIFAIEQLPLALIRGIWFGTGTLALSYLALLSLMKGLSDKKLLPLQFSLFLLILIGIWRSEHLRGAQRQQRLTVYHLNGHTAMDLFYGRRAFCFSDLPADAPKVLMAAENLRASSGIERLVGMPLEDGHFSETSLWQKNDFLWFSGFRVGWIDQLPPHPPPQPINLDLLLVRNNAPLEINALADYFSPQIILFDASSSRYKIDRWVSQCESLDYPYYDVDRHGAWSVLLNQ